MISCRLRTNDLMPRCQNLPSKKYMANPRTLLGHLSSSSMYKLGTELVTLTEQYFPNLLPKMAVSKKSTWKSNNSAHNENKRCFCPQEVVYATRHGNLKCQHLTSCPQTVQQRPNLTQNERKPARIPSFCSHFVAI